MNPGEISRHYDRAAPDYDQHDAFEREVAERLVERMVFTRIPPNRILDLGCGTGSTSHKLLERFPDSEITGLDLSHGMLKKFQDRAGGKQNFQSVLGDLTQLPFTARSADLVFCNLALQWAGDFVHALNEIRRVLRPEGMLLFSVPGPDSLQALRQYPAEGAGSSMPIYMPDLRDVGDCLMSAGFRDPVMDSELLTLSYRSVAQMKTELAVTGGAGFVEVPEIPAKNGGIEISFEIVYGAAFGPADGQPVRTEEGEVATFSVDQLKKL